MLGYEKIKAFTIVFMRKHFLAPEAEREEKMGIVSFFTSELHRESDHYLKLCYMILN